MPYPDNCIRGISSTDHICNQDGEYFANAGLYHQFQTDSKEDGWTRCSIKWMDEQIGCQDVISLTLSQTKEDGSKQFKVGYAIIPQKKLDEIKKRYQRQKGFDYEREALESDPYHGNLLLRQDLTPHLKKVIQYQLAYHSQVILRENLR